MDLQRKTRPTTSHDSVPIYHDGTCVLSSLREVMTDLGIRGIQGIGMNGVAEVSDYPSLRAYDGDEVLIHVTGRTRIGGDAGTRIPEGIAGFFYWDRDAEDTENGGTVFRMDRGGAALRLHEGPINAKWFGVDPTGREESGRAFNSAILASRCKELYTESGQYRIDPDVTNIKVPRNWGMKWTCGGTDTGACAFFSHGHAPDHDPDMALIDVGTLVVHGEDYTWSGFDFSGFEIRGAEHRISGLYLNLVAHPKIEGHINGCIGWGLRVNKNQDGWFKMNIQGCGRTTSTKDKEADPAGYWRDLADNAMTDAPMIEFFSSVPGDACNMLRFEGEVEGQRCSPAIRVDRGIGLWLFNIHAELRQSDLLTYLPDTQFTGNGELANAGTFLQNDSAEIWWSDSEISQSEYLYFGSGYGTIRMDNVNGRGFMSKVHHGVSVAHVMQLSGLTQVGDVEITGSYIQMDPGVQTGNVTLNYPISGSILRGVISTGQFKTQFLAPSNSVLAGIDVIDCRWEGDFNGGTNDGRYVGGTVGGNVRVAQERGMVAFDEVVGTEEILQSLNTRYVPNRRLFNTTYGVARPEDGEGHAKPAGSWHYYLPPLANGDHYAVKGVDGRWCRYPSGDAA